MLAAYPRRNSFPLSLWLHGMWDQKGQRSKSWSMVPHLDGLVVLIDPATLPGRRHPRSRALQGANNAADLLGKFTEKADGTPGQKLRVSLAVVLTDCGSLIRDGALPAAMCWNLPSPPGSRYNPLVQCDTSARLGEYVARHAPAFYKCAHNWFYEVAFFGVGATRTHQGNGQVHRCHDALTWMLAQRRQIPVMKARAAFKRLASHESGDFVFG